MFMISFQNFKNNSMQCMKYFCNTCIFLEHMWKHTRREHIHVPYNTFPKSETLFDSFKENPYMN